MNNADFSRIFSLEANDLLGPEDDRNFITKYVVKGPGPASVEYYDFEVAMAQAENLKSINPDVHYEVMSTCAVAPMPYGVDATAGWVAPTEEELVPIPLDHHFRDTLVFCLKDPSNAGQKRTLLVNSEGELRMTLWLAHPCVLEPISGPADFDNAPQMELDVRRIPVASDTYEDRVARRRPLVAMPKSKM